MKLKLTPVALALCSALPLAAQAAPTVAFVAPTGGQTLSGNMYQSSACEVRGSNIRRVVFYLDSTQLNTETGSPWNCNLDTRKFPNGSHTLRARAYDASGASSTTQIAVNIQNGTTSGGTSGGTTGPTVSFKAPSDGATLASAINQSSACEVTGSGISKVQFFLGSTALNTEGGAPWQCNIDPAKFAAGTYPLKAVAYNSSGATSTAQISVTIGSGGSGGTTAPTVSFKAPANGATISSTTGHSDGGCEALVASATVMKQVQFYLGSTLINSEGVAPYTCLIDPSKFASGTYPLKAVATDDKGGTGSAQVSINIQNGSTGGGSTPPPSGPSVSFKAPAEGATISKTTGHSDGGCEALTTALSGTSVKQVQFYLGATLINTEGVAPYTCLIDPSKFASGTHTLKAVATDDKGGTGTAQVSINIQNGATSGGGTGGDGGGTLPSTDTKAVATFQSLGLYWKPPANPGAAGCEVRYRKTGDAAWKQGLALWYDSRNSECRGSLVLLQPATEYEVQFAMPGKSPAAALKATTWSENFPIAKTIQVQSGAQTLAITEGGTKDGYVLYTGPATLDAGDAQNYNITISAPYVIVRGLTLKGAKADAIRLLPGAKDVVIEGNDISGWGRQGVDRDSAIQANCSGQPKFLERVVVQRNKMHHPRYSANSWDGDGTQNIHPAGPQGVTFNMCGGNHVLRYNEVYSSDGGNYFNDAFSGGANFSDNGFPDSDTDIHGNRISHTWDDGIEAEGGMRNVRIWGNYIDQTATGIASTVVHHGPAYIFRNVYNRSRMYKHKPLDSDGRNSYFKSGDKGGYGSGRRYVFHNTSLQARQSGVTNGLGAGAGLKGNTDSPLTNTVSRNNIYHVWKSSAVSVGQQSGSFGNDADYDLFNGAISSFPGAEVNGMVGTPIYKSGHGWENWAGGNYQLESNSPGYDKGARLPNFNDSFTGAAPDVGAHEAGMPPMKFGVQ